MGDVTARSQSSAGESPRWPVIAPTGPTSGCRKHAVVLGGRISGLLAARVLADQFERVTIIDREPDEDQSEAGQAGSSWPPILRPGSPALLLDAPVLDSLERLWPGISVELTAAGARPATPWKVLATRVFVERHVRRRLAVLDNVRFVYGHDVVGLQADGRRCVGVWVLSRRPSAAARAVGADLVVDATGPRSRLTRWLADRWSSVVPIERHELRRYQCRLLRLPSIRSKPLVRGPAEPPYEWLIMGVEDGCHVVAVSDLAGGRPIRTDHLATMIGRRLDPDLALAVRRGVPVGGSCVFDAPCLGRRRFDLAEGMPSGVIAVGASLQQADPLSGSDVELALRHLSQLAPC